MWTCTLFRSSRGDGSAVSVCWMWRRQSGVVVLLPAELSHGPTGSTLAWMKTLLPTRPRAAQACSVSCGITWRRLSERCHVTTKSQFQSPKLTHTDFVVHMVQYLHIFTAFFHLISDLWDESITWIYHMKTKAAKNSQICPPEISRCCEQSCRSAKGKCCHTRRTGSFTSPQVQTDSVDQHWLMTPSIYCKPPASHAIP